MYKEALLEFEKIASGLSSEELEVYANEVLTELQKEASRRYKAIIGELSPDNLKRLVQPQSPRINLSRGEAEALSGKNYMQRDYKIHDYKREATGLNTGSGILTKKHDILVENLSEREFANKAARTALDNTTNADLVRGARNLPKDREVSVLQRKILRKQDQQALSEAIRGAYKSSAGYMSTHSGKKGQRIVNLGDIDRSGSMFDSYTFSKVNRPKKGTVARDYLDAVLKRHEIDENIDTFAARKNMKLSMGRSTSPEERMQTTTFAGHGTPKVVLRESAHVAGAPPETKQFVEHLRNITGETGFMKEHFGHSYGSSGNFDRRTARKAERLLDRINRPVLEPLI